jgi:hypothetical protein
MFKIRDLSVLAYANGFTLWHYKAGQDPLYDVCEPGFFNEAADLLAAGDLIMISGVAAARIRALATIDGGVVCTAPLS